MPYIQLIIIFLSLLFLRKNNNREMEAARLALLHLNSLNRLIHYYFPVINATNGIALVFASFSGDK